MILVAVEWFSVVVYSGLGVETRGLFGMATLVTVLQTQVMSPSSVSMPTTSTRRSTSSDSNQIFPHDCNATIAVTSEEPDVPRHSGAFSSSMHTAAATRMLTVLGSLGDCLWRQLADFESVDSRKSIMETCADLDRESVVSTLFRSESKGKRDRDQNVVQSLRD